jgi:hypothetical protein
MLKRFTFAVALGSNLTAAATTLAGVGVDYDRAPYSPAICPQTTALAESTAFVDIQLRQVGRKIPSDFLGFSYEAPVLSGDDFDVRNTGLVNLLANLGTGTLRYGGHSVELTGWSRSPRPKADGESGVLTPKDLDRVFAFSRVTGWKVILGLNVAHGDTTLAADEAAYAVSQGGAQLLALEIGNEPDLYVRIFGLRPPSWGYQDFRREFETYRRAILARERRAQIAGPTTAADSLVSRPMGLTIWFPEFIKDEGSVLALATQHVYPMISGTGTQLLRFGITADSAQYPSIANMLSPTLTQRVANEIDDFTRVAAAKHLALRITETNSAARGGQDGVSNVFASALWGADYAFTLAEHGAEGVNFHGAFECRGYTPMCRSENHYIAQPLYYGMLLFHTATPGRIVPLRVQSSANLAAHAVLRDDDRLALVLINKDAHQSERVTIRGIDSYRRGNVLRLSGEALDSARGITFGGHAVAADGTWLPSAGETLVRAHQAFEVAVPAASALIVRFER